MNHFVSVIDEAYKAFVQNMVNVQNCRCKIGMITVGDKRIDPDIFNKQAKKEGIWE